MSMLEVQNLSVRFGSAVIVNDVSFSVQDGDWLMLIGPNGAGKSTIVNAVSRGVPYTGTVLFEGKDVQKTPAHLLARGMGVLAQHHTVGYAFSVEEVVRLGRYAYAPGIFSRRSDEDERSVAEAMELTGVAHIARQSVLTLSGGELQRVFLAQLFAQNPRLLLLDEPTNHLDLVYQKQIFSLEPREIGLLVRQQKAMMESIYEGVIAIDRESRIEVINQAARKLLGLSQPTRALRGHAISDVIAPVPFFAAATMLESDTHDEICRFNHLTVIASRVRIMLEDSLQGWVITFRDRNEIDSLSAQLSQVKRYADNLRIMRHEQLNRMTTLSGLLHMERYDEAVNYIQAQSEHAQELLDFISSRFTSPTICGLLLGKAARAREKGVELNFDPLSRMDRPCRGLAEAELISIIGNLLDNAIEATQRATLPHDPVDVLILLNERELIIEVADRGIGIDPAIADRIFERGVTTKRRGDHGIGLYLIASYVTQAGGAIEVSANAPRGTIFSLFIPETGSAPRPVATVDEMYAT